MSFFLYQFTRHLNDILISLIQALSKCLEVIMVLSYAAPFVTFDEKFCINIIFHIFQYLVGSEKINQKKTIFSQ